ncbi:FAD-binding and (Fe-S)-binding domain-containing protein [Ascidiimonas aurantiaca]|uniref:FAD-binding and (Fe-S)-binding domain-containing protein n=1 Tax=Ascidiimonas aurantiaca TaxID=1685432 RepID=UPI0030ED0D73
MSSKFLFDSLERELKGDLFTDTLHKALYATDASVYRKTPQAVCFPRNKSDLIKIIHFANKHSLGIIPRTAGTSLAGQCVGEGIVVDVSRYFTKILEVDTREKTVTVEPGVIRDELNLYLEPHGLFFGPNTSTSNRCMIGGMTGNNSSGTTSIQYGVTRDKVLEMDVLLSDGSEVTFKELTSEEFNGKTQLETLEGTIYRNIVSLLSPAKVQAGILEEYPKPEIHRRNTGYAIDELIKMDPFTAGGVPFNMCKLLSGSEGTLAFTTRIKLQLDILPPPYKVMIAAHFESIEKACKAVVPSMQHDLATCELMDKVILDCTKNNKSQQPNRFFIEGDPQGVLMLELHDKDEEILEHRRQALLKTLEASQLCYAMPSLYREDIGKALELRKAGLGLLGNMVGDKKAVACIEDTAVALDDLAPYIEEFTALMTTYGQKAVYYAHAGAGELHLRPILDLKKEKDVKLFRKITEDVARLVKKYKGSLSGEHGDGVVRGEFIEFMVGKENYHILKAIKQCFDPKGIFNPGKIVDAYPMDKDLRYKTERKEPEITTFFDFSDSEGILRAAEKCNGSGDCRKTHLSKGAMCPSYHATKNEKDTTRARANALREFLTQSQKPNKFDHKELKEVFDLCLSCKACSSECPSNVDIATLKAEFLYQYQQANGTRFRDRVFAHNTKLNALAAKVPALTNRVYKTPFLSAIIKKTLGVHPQRSLPEVHKVNFDQVLNQYKNTSSSKKEVILFIDEFTRYMDTQIGVDAIEVLCRLGYKVSLFYGESGRTFLSKGFLKEAHLLANTNIKALKKVMIPGKVFLGLEPSAILSFRDEYVRMVNDIDTAQYISKNSFLIEEFLASEIENGAITSHAFTQEKRTIKIHGHCHQKALSNQKCTFTMLNIPENYRVTIIPSGCCGMAGSFGYEQEHYEVSMKVGALTLFPAVKNAAENTIIAANGTSCRHQVFDGTGKKAHHPISIFKEALK